MKIYKDCAGMFTTLTTVLNANKNDRQFSRWQCMVWAGTRDDRECSISHRSDFNNILTECTSEHLQFSTTEA